MVCKSAQYQGVDQAHKEWANWAGTVTSTVAHYFEPEGLEDLVNVVERASSEGKELHPVGSGWAFEDAAVSPHWMLSLAKLTGQLKYVTKNALTLEWQSIQNDVNATERIVHFEAGIEIAILNDKLAEQGLAMLTLGGANGQTLAGAISTSTHGGDPLIPPLPDVVQAIHLVTDGGRELWIERASAPVTTDAGLHAVLPCKDTTIVRNDDTFNAVLVSVGRCGVIYSFVLKVTQAFRLAEWTVTLPKSELLSLLTTGVDDGSLLKPLIDALPPPPDALGADTSQSPHFVEIIFNSQDTATCWIRRRWLTADQSDLNMDAGESFLCNSLGASAVLTAAILALANHAAQVGLIPGYGVVLQIKTLAEIDKLERASQNPTLTGGEVLALVVNALWNVELGILVPKFSAMALGNQFDASSKAGRRGPSHLIMTNTRAQNQSKCYRGESSELIFPASTKAYLDFLTIVLQVAPSFRQSGYISMRYSAASKAHLSMHNVEAPMAVSIETASLKDLQGNAQWFPFVETIATAGGGRPHWGQINSLTAPEVEQLYHDHLNTWREALLHISGTSRTFSNNYTRRRGLEPQGIIREVTGTGKSHEKPTEGNILYLCGDSKSDWSPISLAHAIRDIETGVAKYYTRVEEGWADIEVVAGRYLRTTADSTTRNNLDDLPDC